MEDQRRQELQARRKALQEELASPLRESAISDALREAAVPFELSQVGLWTPPYLGISSSRIDWSRSPAPARTFPSETLEDRVFAARSFLGEVAAPSDKLHFYYEYNYTSLDMLAADALRALNVLMNSDNEIWITARPANWLIEIYRYGEARLALPYDPKPAEQEAQLARQYSHVGGLVDTLRAAGISVDLFSREDPAGPEQPRGPVMHKWRERKRTVGIPVARGDYAGLADRLCQFFAENALEIDDIAIDPGIVEAPILVASCAEILAHPKPIMALMELRKAEQSSPVANNTITIFPKDGSWAIKIVGDGPRWKVETTRERA
ncbi:hypothetical protein [Erythrobacter sp. A6_0]|uniref:hypothetical protein n=1 Tax=Erythrobacter sp. A6_0 TaxID=2821089 RepID=UPI001ADA7C74|nr:hypothetical protein [Erythrobacter sp. A6_0]MBO9511677.1 hypothetical protein [Erythrobacter sp. A6_0]